MGDFNGTVKDNESWNSRIGMEGFASSSAAMRCCLESMGLVDLGSSWLLCGIDDEIAMVQITTDSVSDHTLILLNTVGFKAGVSSFSKLKLCGRRIYEVIRGNTLETEVKGPMNK
ncbi:hypothetical protein PanWU01x14_015660 [Parasponia andersonii]|uniref:Endonuclease/exonuclease/phosphatase n=1 Tax=Parasponia andersonii TaxID=3476 RepID=A0A2P5E0J3_PARAD|nr:hypothetical protein PanWU01x14_015660 [Parasponia andersonii]